MKTWQNFYCWLLWLGAVLGLASVGMAQQSTVPASANAASKVTQAFRTLPSQLNNVVSAIGDRVQKPGKERTTLNGLFTDAGGTRPVTITHELPKLVSVTGLNGKAPALSVDAERSNGTLGHADEALLESFSEDTIEALCASVGDGNAVQLLGRGFAPATQNYTGPHYDIFEVTAPTKTDGRQTMRVKRYYLDSGTGLLLSTRYVDNSTARSVEVETRFANWSTTDGSSYPGRIERYEDGRLVFSFVVQSLTPTAAQGANSFRLP